METANQVRPCRPGALSSSAGLLFRLWNSCTPNLSHTPAVVRRPDLGLTAGVAENLSEPNGIRCGVIDIFERAVRLTLTVYPPFTTGPNDQKPTSLHQSQSFCRSRETLPNTGALGR